MRLLPLIFSILILARASSPAAEAPVGEWLVPDGYSTGVRQGSNRELRRRAMGRSVRGVNAKARLRES
jgi:hypothetical protein